MSNRTCAQTSASRFWAKVTKTDSCWEWTGAKDTAGYGCVTIDKKSQRVHRTAYQWLVGPIPPGMCIDHICHNRACVNPAHLRPATTKQNAENRSELNSNNNSGARGVSWYSSRQCWVAQVRHNGGFVLNAYFDDFDEADRASRRVRARYFTHSAEAA